MQAPLAGRIGRTRFSGIVMNTLEGNQMSMTTFLAVKASARVLSSSCVYVEAQHGSSGAENAQINNVV